MKVKKKKKKQKKNPHSILTCYKDSRPCPPVNISWTPRWRKLHDTFATPDHPQVLLVWSKVPIRVVRTGTNKTYTDKIKKAWLWLDSDRQDCLKIYFIYLQIKSISDRQDCLKIYFIYLQIKSNFVNGIFSVLVLKHQTWALLFKAPLA